MTVETSHLVLLFLISMVNGAGAFFAGMFWERGNWNGLIARGKLPAPGEPWIKL